MATVCPNMPAIIADQRFQDLKERYKDRKLSDFVLAVKLKCFRNAEDFDLDWFPTEESDYKLFTDYLNRPIDNERSPKIKKEDLDGLYKAMTSLYSSPKILEQRLGLISRWFKTRVDRLQKSYPTLERTQIIRSQSKKDRNGYQSIMDDVFAMVKDLSTIEGQKKVFDAQNPNAPESLWESQKDFWQYRADEFAKIYENKEFLAALAAPMISTTEGIAISIDGLTFDIKEEVETEIEDAEEFDDESEDKGEAQKGERFVDFRILSMMSTISSKAKNLINKLNRVDSTGALVRDDLGYTIPLDIKQVAIALHKVLRTTEPAEMMNVLRDSVTQYPSLKSLVDYLEKNKDDRGIIYTNFKKAKSTYYYGYKDKSGRLDVHSSGNAADGYNLSSEAGANISIGSTGEEKNSVVDDNGNLKGNDLFAKLYDKEFYQELKDIDWQEYSSKNDKTVNELASRLRGLGFQVTSEEIKDALSSYPADFRFNGGTVLESNPTEYLSSALRDIYDKGTGIIKLGDDLTGTHLYTYAQNSFSQISRVLSPIQKGEVEERIISGSKSLATNNNPNALHQLVDSISNAKHLSSEDYKKEMERDYGRYEGMGLGFGEDVQLTGWLADASGDTDVNWNPESFRLIDMTDSNKTDYEHLTKQQHLVNSYVMYMNGAKNRTDSIADNGRMYEIPIQADYETAYNFIFAPEYTREQLIERLAQEVECEAQRIAAIKERKANDPTDPNAEYIRPVVKTYEKRGVKFQIFPELNTSGFVEAYANANDPVEAHNIVKQAVAEQLEKIYASELEKLMSDNFFSDDNTKLTGIKSIDAESVRNWILNSFYARQQITKLLYGGLENFKSTSDFEKRNMYAHATRIPLYTEAYYNGEKVGKENQRVVYISDDESKSVIYANIEKIAERLKNEGKITPEQAERMKNAYKNITTTDGQGIRTLDSMREVKIMASLWTDADEQAYKNIKSRNYKPEDVEHFMVGLKPVYTGYEILAAQPGQYQKPQRVPVLHKYSEMVLLPEIMEGVSLQNDTVPFKAFNKINNKLGEKNKIDLFIFGSGVKVGSHSTINAFAKENDERILKDAESISNFVVNKINSGNFWVHTLPYKYYGISAATHADVVDTNIAWASQAEKEAWANILPNEKISVNGQEMQATEARELYNRIKKARTIDTFENLRKLFYSDHQLATILKEELASKPYQSREISFILQVIDGEGSWDSPLYQPSIQHDAVALLSSILRKRLTKVPTKGANILQTSGFGMDMDASGFDETNAIKDSDKLEVKFDENGNFKYVEAYVPIYDSRLLQFADENGNISAERLNKLIDDGIIPESVLHFIAYRTPSDAEHSIIPCRVKGFIANAAGATIRLPKEIMPMTGHDYDGDKMRCHFKEFYIGYDDNKIRKDFDKFSDTEAVRAILDENADPTLTPYEVFMRNVTSESNPEAWKYRVVKDVEYDYSKTPIDNIGNNSDYRKLNNALVDLMFSQLASPAGSMKMFIPGGSAETTMYARIMQIIRATKDKDVKKAIANHLVSEKKYSSETVSDALSNTVNLYNFLLNKSEDTLSDLVGIIEGSESPFTVTHASDSHEYMMDGAGMIGVYAVYNSAAAMFQRLNLEYKPQTEKTKTENGVVNETINVSLFNKTIGKLFNVLSHDALGNSSYSTLGLARLVNAAVDNGKNPVLGHLNQTAGLAPMTNFLFAAGLSEEEIHLIMNQPAVIELGKRMKDPNAPGFSESAKKVLSEIIQQLPNGVKYGTKSSITAVSTMKMDDYIKNLDKSFQDVLVGNKNIKESQIHLLKTLIHLYGAAAELDSFTKLTRPESNSGSIDSSLGGTVAKIIQLDNFRAKQGKQISGTNKAIEEKEVYFNSMTEDMMSNAIGDSLPEVAALNTYLKDILPRLFREKFPQTRESWMNVTKRIANQYSYERIPGKVVERIQSDMLLWKLLSNSNFTTDNPQEEQRRILFDVPEQLRAFKNRIQEAIKNPGSDAIAEKFADNVFLNNLDLGTTLNDENNTVRRIRFKMNGPAVENTADLIRAGWDQLWRNEETKQLAEDLFKYNLYTNGFSYGRYEFFHYAPFSVVNGMNGYNQALKEILSEGWTDEEEEQFFHQYYRNHWGDKNLFQEIKPEQIPMKLRDDVGIKSNSNSNINIVQFGFIIGNAEYIIVPQKINGNIEDKLYQVIRTDGGLVVGIKEATKLGLRNRNNQVMVQYNPKVRDYNEVKPVFKSNKVSWETKKATGAYNASAVDAESGMSEEDRQAAIDDIPFAIPIPTAESVKKLEDVAESASKSNGKLTAEQAAMFGFEDEGEEGLSAYGSGNTIIQHKKSKSINSIINITQNASGRLGKYDKEDEDAYQKAKQVLRDEKSSATQINKAEKVLNYLYNKKREELKAVLDKISEQTGVKFDIEDAGGSWLGGEEYSFKIKVNANEQSDYDNAIFALSYVAEAARQDAFIENLGEVNKNDVTSETLLSGEHTPYIHIPFTKRLNTQELARVQEVFNNQNTEEIPVDATITENEISFGFPAWKLGDNATEDAYKELYEKWSNKIEEIFNNGKEGKLKGLVGENYRHAYEKSRFYTADNAYSEDAERTYSNFRDNYIRQKSERNYTEQNGQEVKSFSEKQFITPENGGLFYLVERDEHGNPVRKGYPGTPGVVAKAREQQAFVELNKKLREILRKHGVSIGVLEEAEAKLMAGGVTDFSTAHVLGEGMKELIRLSNGIEGEWALPEEFAHVAIEMLGRNHPLVSRLLNAIARDDAALEEAYDGMLDEYKKHYGDDREKLIVEAAGKLVAKHLFQHQLTKTPSIKNIVKKVCTAIKTFFKTWSIREVENAIFDAEGIASQLARDLLSGRLADEMSLDKISTSDKFLNIDKDLSEKNDIISKLMRKPRKQIDVLQRRVKYRLSKGGSSRSLDEAQNQLAKLEDALKNQKFETTIVDYLSDAMNFMKEMETATDATINNSPANAVCRKLQVVRDTLFGYASVMQDIKDALDNGEIKDEANLRSSLREVSNQIEDYISKYDRISMKYFEKFLSNVYGEEGITINVGKQKGRRITIEEMARKADHDISMMSRLLHAASDIDDYVIQAMDSVTRDAKIAARKRALALRPKLEVAMAALIKEQGNRDQSWMYERTKVNGKIVRTGRYISQEQADKLSDAKKNFYKVFMELKHLADQCVPEMMVGDRKMIMLRKEHYEKMKDAKGVGEKSGEVWDSVKNSVLEMGDIDLENEQVVTDFADNKVDQLPLKFLNKGKNESYDDMTEDAATSLMAYIGMAFEYKEMNNVIGMLENARYMAGKRDVQQRKGLKLKVEKIGDEKDFHYTKPYTVKQAKTNLQIAIDDFYQMHVYGHLRKDEGTFGKTRISKRKSVDTLNRITSLSQMALNLHQRIANVNTGFTQILVETAGGKIKAKDVAWATGVWTTHSAKRMSETGNTDYSDKLSLWMDYFDIHQDNGRDAQLTKYGRTRGSRVFNEGLLYAGLSIGEDFMAGTTALALSRKYKLKGPNGEESNMWDAYEVKYADNANKTGAYLALKKGYTKEDGSAITAEDEKKFQKEVIGTNFELQGIYNTDDRSALQQSSLGALAIMYRKWIAPAMKRRYAGTTYSNLKGDFQEGYYNTTIRLLSEDIKDIFKPASEEEANKTILQILTDIKALKNSINLNWDKLNDYEKGNVHKAMTELAVVFGLIVASAFLTNLPPDDDDNKFLAWAQDIAITQILRLRSEIGSMAPTPMQASEALRIASSPFAALRPLRDSLNIFQLLWPSNYWEEVDSGRYKGRTKAHKYFMKLPVISMFRKLDNFVDPTDMINYYKNINN